MLTNIRLSVGAWIYLGILSCVAVAAILPTSINSTIFGALFLLALPVSFGAVVFGLLSSAVIFQDPTRNDILLRAWVLIVWLSAILIQTLVLESIRQQGTRRDL